MQLLEGIFPAIITPFDRDGKLMEDDLCTLVEYLIDKGVQGFYVGGSSGEAILMNKKERKRVLELVKKQTAGRVKVVAHIGCQYTGDSIDLAKHAAEQGVDAISSLPPYYYKYSLNELTAYYEDIIRAVPLQMIVYNAPALTGVAFNSDNIAPIFTNELAIGVKYTSYDLYQMQRLVARYPNKLIINGHDEQLLSALSVGVRCAIGSTFILMPETYLGIMKSFAENDMARALKLQNQANKVMETLLDIGIFRAVKGTLNLLGLPAGNCRKPFAPLSKDEMVRLEKLLPIIREA